MKIIKELYDIAENIDQKNKLKKWVRENIEYLSVTKTVCSDLLNMYRDNDNLGGDWKIRNEIERELKQHLSKNLKIDYKWKNLDGSLIDYDKGFPETYLLETIAYCYILKNELGDI